MRRDSNIRESRLKAQLLRQLLREGAFWSFRQSSVTPDSVRDDLLIEKVLTHLDIDDINKLFAVYPEGKIRQVWRRRLCVQEPRYHGLNKLLAVLYFGIKNPERYLMQAGRQHLRQLQQRADEWFSAAYGENF